MVKKPELGAKSLVRSLRKRAVAGVAVGLVAGWTMLAYSGALDSVFRQKGKKGGTVSTASFNANSPSKEYIYAGGRLVATEEPTTSGGCTAPPSPGNSLVATAQTST